MDFTLRLAEMSDIQELQILILLSARILQVPYYTPAQIEGALGTVFGVDSQLIRDGTYFVAEFDSQIVGCGGWSRRAALFGGDREKRAVDALLDPAVDPARIRAFFVHPEYVRRGIGSKIMERSEAAAFAAGFRRVDIVATLAGEPLYLRFGYELGGRFEIPLSNGERLPVVRLTKTTRTPVQRITSQDGQAPRPDL